MVSNTARNARALPKQRICVPSRRARISALSSGNDPRKPSSGPIYVEITNYKGGKSGKGSGAPDLSRRSVTADRTIIVSRVCFVEGFFGTWRPNACQWGSAFPRFFPGWRGVLAGHFHWLRWVSGVDLRCDGDQERRAGFSFLRLALPRADRPCSRAPADSLRPEPAAWSLGGARWPPKPPPLRRTEPAYS